MRDFHSILQNAFTSLPAFMAKFARVNYPQHDESEFPEGRQAKGFSPSVDAFLSLNVGISERE
jgi:hypothetical protein